MFEYVSGHVDGSFSSYSFCAHIRSPAAHGILVGQGWFLCLVEMTPCARCGRTVSGMPTFYNLTVK